MRIISAVMLLACSVSIGFGNESDPQTISPVAILKHTWYLDSGILRDSSLAALNDASTPPVGIPGTPSSGRQSSQQAALARPVSPDSPPPEQTKTRDVFRYVVTLRNESDKPIRRVFWSYVFLNPETNAVISRHRFATDTKIKPGKSKKLEGLTYLPPSNVSSVRAMKHGPGWEKSERVDIFRIQFADGTFWSRRRLAPQSNP